MDIKRVLLYPKDNCGCGCGSHGTEPKEGEEERLYWERAKNDEVICHCAQVVKETIVAAIRNGAYTAPLVKVLTGIGRGHPCPNNRDCLRILAYLLNIYGQTTLSDALLVLESEKDTAEGTISE